MSTESFIPPVFNYPFLWFIDATMSMLLKMVHNVEEVVLTDSDKILLKSLRNERVVFLSNHPSTKEPPISYFIGNHTYSRFHYMASREVFDWGSGLVGKMIQNIGAYSVIAGSSDRESLKATRSILASPAGKLVLFPEGEPTGAENDNLLPFQSGIAQLAFWGYEDALKNDPKADIIFLPTFIKYRMNGSVDAVRNDMDKSMEVLENRLHISKKGKTAVHRLLSIGKRIMEKAEREFGIIPDESHDYDYRVGRLRHCILDNIAETLNIKRYNKEAHAIDKLRQLLSTFELVFIGAPDPKKELPTLESARWGRKLCQKAYDFIAIKTDYIKSLPSAERMYEWLNRFELEIVGYSSKRPMSAHVRFAPIFKISSYYEQYKKDKRAAVEGLTNRLRSDIQNLLNEEIRKSYPLFPLDYKF